MAFVSLSDLNIALIKSVTKRKELAIIYKAYLRNYMNNMDSKSMSICYIFLDLNKIRL